MNANASKLKVLALENDANDALLLARELRNVATVDVAISGKAFRDMLNEKWDVLLCDLALPDIKGEEAIRLARGLHSALPIIIVTGSVSAREADLACEAGASRFFIKGMDGVPGLAKAVQRAHEHARQEREVAKLKAQSLRDQRLELLGQLSAGLVHDFNGILAVLMMGVEHLRQRIVPQDAKVLDTMLSATKRGGEMTGQFLAFARGTNGAAFKNVAPEYLLGEVRTLVKATFPANIRVEIETAIGTSHIRGDATQLAQVLANLATNARDAMTPQGGVLKIAAQNVSRVNGMQGPCVVISVADTGTGIPDEALPHIWEPFFSTKAPGHGTGLGLPTVKSIVEAHHGTIDMITGKEGTSFFVNLPIALPWAAQDAGEGSPTSGTGRTVLLCDDQQSFLDLARMILEGAGYKVLTAANGPEALNYFRVGQQIDVVLTDLSMPVMGGDELARNLRSVGLTVPIIYLSGYDATTARDPEPQAVIQKPVSREVLLSTLSRVLTTAGSAGKPAA